MSISEKCGYTLCIHNWSIRETKEYKNIKQSLKTEISMLISEKKIDFKIKKNS